MTLMTSLSAAQAALGLGSGALVGFALGLVGGGGSILAVPLLVYLVGVASPHEAIGTSAVAVAFNALLSLGAHARKGHVKWPCGLVFAGAGAIGALGGSTLGKALNGETLLAVFGLLMVAIGVHSFLRRGGEGEPLVRLSHQNAVSLVIAGFIAGALSGFFGIGGGFLIVPALMMATGMPPIYAVGTSLVAVTSFGAATAANYALSGLVHWPLAALFVLGGALGGRLGVSAAARLALRKGRLEASFAVFVALVGVYVVARAAL